MAKKGWIDKIMADFTTVAWVIIPIAIGINQAGRLIHEALGLPVWLDTIGTMFTAMLCGPWVAAIGGFLTNVVTAIAYGRATSVFFGIVQLGIGLIIGYCTIKGWLKKWWHVPIVGLVTTVVATLISSVIVVLVRGGVSGQGVDLIFAFFLASGQGFWESIFASRFITELLDKAVISIYIAWIAVKNLPKKYTKLFNYVKNITGK